MSWARTYIRIAGILGVLTGVLGFIDNPFIGYRAIFATDAVHNLIHIATGLLAGWIGWRTAGKRLAHGVTWFGVLYIALFAVMLLSPTLFGLLSVPVNNTDHVLHAALGLTTLAIGWTALRSATATPQRATT